MTTNNEKIRDLFHAECERARQMIYAGTLKSMKSIRDNAWDRYEKTSLNDYLLDSVYGVDGMIRLLLESYIIHCETTKQIPVSGY